ncbi:hypothetical protein [Streptomyces sp. NPDC058045]|uniref:hypothetical protein n=1 Tax=Streptomyces sp. NPDC058045 TaxID=3346311 RepID=UPI0036E29A94
MFAPSVERPWRDGWPLVAQPDDGNGWEAGECWLFCRRTGVAVLWVGSVITPGATGDVYACGACLAELERMVRVRAHGLDRSEGRTPAPPPTLAVPTGPPPPPALPGDRSGGRHRAPRRSRDKDAKSTGTGIRGRACEHRWTELRGGKTHCQDCHAQLYL